MSYSSPQPTRSPSRSEPDVSGRHPVNVGHLVMGVAFLGLTAIWVLFETSTIGDDDLRWLLPVPWLAAGLAGLLAVTLSSRRREPQWSTPSDLGEPGPSWSEPDGPSWFQPEETQPDDLADRDDRT